MTKKSVSYAKCINCRQSHDVTKLEKLVSASGGYKYICKDCTTLTYSYFAENNTLAHTEKAHQMTLSFEYEQGSRSLQSNILYEYGFIPTDDATVAVEWKSPIYYSLCGIVKQLRTMESVDDTDYRCGTHLNVGCANKANMRIELIRRHFNTLFIPLEKHVERHYTGSMSQIFGRGLGGWASKIDQSDAQEHRNWINCQHDTHLELRVAKFRTAEQYMSLIRWWTESVEWIVKEFNTNCTPATTKAEDNMLAQATAVKLTKIFDKHFKQYKFM